MPDHNLQDCPQGPSIKQISELVAELAPQVKFAVGQVQSAVDRMEARDVKLMEALEKVADQNARIDAQQNDIQHLHRDHENLFDRVRGIEAAIGEKGATMKLEIEHVVDKTFEEKCQKLLTIATVLTSRPGLAVIGGLLTLVVMNAVMSVMFHFEGVAQFFRIVKQAWGAV